MSHGTKLMVAVAVLVGMSSMWAESQGVGVLIEADDFRQLLTPFSGSTEDSNARQFAVTGTHTTLADTIAVAEAGYPAAQQTADAQTNVKHSLESGKKDTAAGQTNAQPAYGTSTQSTQLSKLVQRLDGVRNGQGRPIHVVQIGDSEVASDAVTMTARALAAKDFGDGGPGFFLAMKPWPSYGRSGILHPSPKDKFKVGSFPRRQLRDGHYGPGGVGFEPSGGYASFVTLRSELVDKPCTISLVYQQRPRGGAIRIVGNKKQLAEFQTAGEKDVARHTVRADACPSSIGFQWRGGGGIRVYGWQIHSDSPGMAWTSIGVNGARYAHLNNYADGAFLRALEVIEPDLLIFGFGLNVTSYPVGPNPNYEARMDKALSQVKPLFEKVPCLIVGPYPVAAKVGTRLQLSPTVSKVLEIQQRVSQKYGCTFLDRFERFGGASALEKWRRGQPRMLSADNTHLTREGSRQMGEFLYKYVTTELVKSSTTNEP